jgi:hypothetical protein
MDETMKSTEFPPMDALRFLLFQISSMERCGGKVVNARREALTHWLPFRAYDKSVVAPLKRPGASEEGMD